LVGLIEDGDLVAERVETLLRTVLVERVGVGALVLTVLLAGAFCLTVAGRDCRGAGVDGVCGLEALAEAFELDDSDLLSVASLVWRAKTLAVKINKVAETNT
jgi:hypothetical protein